MKCEEVRVGKASDPLRLTLGSGPTYPLRIFRTTVYSPIVVQRFLTDLVQ